MHVNIVTYSEFDKGLWHKRILIEVFCIKDASQVHWGHWGASDRLISLISSEPGPVHQEGVDSKLSSTELHATEPQSPPRPVDTGLQEHTDDNCLYCSGLSVLGLKSQNCGPGGIYTYINCILYYS